MSKEALIPGFGERVRRLREKAKLTQAELSARANIPQGNISEIETGRRTPSLVVAHRLARALRTTVDRLIEG